MSDFWPHGEVARLYDVFRSDGRSERAIFVIDREGLVRFIRVYPLDEQPDNEDLFEVLKIIDPEAAAASEKYQPEPAMDKLPQDGVVMYCNRWCPDCRRARAWLQARDIAFTEVDIDRTPEAAKQVKEWSGGYRITPTFDVYGTVVFNFDEAKLQEALKNSRQSVDNR